MTNITFVVGATGSGKNYFLSNCKDKFCLAVSATTRSIRDGEIDGYDYYFMDEDVFNDQIFAEYINFGSVSYGITEDEIYTTLNSGKEPLFIVEPNGLIQLIRWFKTHVKNFKLNIIHLNIPRIERFKNLINFYKKDSVSEDQALSLALDRIVRGGDTINELFDKRSNEIKDLIIDLDCNIIILKSAKELDEYIESILN